MTAVEITSRGFAYQKEDDLFEEAKDIVRKVVAQSDIKEIAGDYNGLKNAIRKELKNLLFRKTRRNPMILSLILEN